MIRFRKRLIFSFIVLMLIVLVLATYFLFDLETDLSNVLAIVASLLAIITGVIAIFMSFIEVNKAKLDAVKDYFQQGDDNEYVDARKYIFNNYKYSKNYNIKEKYSESKAKVCNFFHFWGLMNRKGYLPIWVFEGSSGVQVVKLFFILYGDIIESRKQNKFYAIEFERLVKRILIKYKKNFIGFDFIDDYNIDCCNILKELRINF